MRARPEPEDLAQQLRHLVGLAPGWPIEVTGPAAVLPSSFAVDLGAAALVAAMASAVADIDHRRLGGVRRTVRTDTVAAALAFQSERHLEQPDTPALWDPLAGHYETSDGHVQFHTNFEHHKYGLLDGLDLSRDASRDDVERVCRTHGSDELEQRVSAAGGIAATLRTFDQWSQTDHGRHRVTDSPVTITAPTASATRTVDGVLAIDALRDTSSARPLEGLRVLDLTRIIAGPVASRNLAAYGAEVLRIGAADLPVVDSILPDTTLGKGFAELDLRTVGGRQRLMSLVRDAHVLISGFRPGALAGLGVDHDTLREANQNLIIAELSAFGHTGPWGTRRGFDSITQTATGIVAAETDAFDAPAPRPLPCQFLDHGSGYLLSLGVLGAVAAQQQQPGSYLVRTALLDTRNWLVDLGRVDHVAVEAPSRAVVEQHLVSRDSAFGPIAHIAHPGVIDGVENDYRRGPSPSGADPADWSTR